MGWVVAVTFSSEKFIGAELIGLEGFLHIVIFPVPLRASNMH
jgi:hypothetical protein